MTCGASAGLAAAFHAPLAGMMFALEEIHKGFSVSLLVSVMTASVTADYICSHIMGIDPVFQFELDRFLPQELYWTLLLLGVLLGLMGALYNKVMTKAQDLYKKPGFLNETSRLVIAVSGSRGAGASDAVGPGKRQQFDRFPDGRGNGPYAGPSDVCGQNFFFQAVSFGSGAPGGIFFPLLILGALIGGAFAMAGVEFFGMDPGYINNFVLLSMAGFFTAIVRAPITGIILLFEMSGSVSQMLSLAIVSVVAYITATLVKSEPIYESLLNRLIAGQEKAVLDRKCRKCRPENVRKRRRAEGLKRVRDHERLRPGRPDGHGDPLAEELPSRGPGTGRERDHPPGEDEAHGRRPAHCYDG